MTENSVVPASEEEEQQPIVAFEPIDTEGLDELDLEDFKLPIIRIVQAQSRNAPAAGQTTPGSPVLSTRG